MTLSDGWLEIVHERTHAHPPRAALFDFDGTLSLIREGWQDVMIPMMVDILLATPRAEGRAVVEQVVREFVADLTGRQTVYQMIRLAEEVTKRGGVPREPLDYKHEYLRRLDVRIADRVQGLEARKLRPGQFLVPGALGFLEGLSRRGVAIYCASGTDESYARHEADLLDVSRFFVGGLRGAIDDYKRFSKQLVIKSIISECGLKGEELVVVGDGFVEIQEGAAVDGVTLGLATDEQALLASIASASSNQNTAVDSWKRPRLIAAGADVIIPDFRQTDRLVRWLFAE
jgi:phosphoglycolate phosphatase-like HAD superfamily hydrolase